MHNYFFFVGIFLGIVLENNGKILTLSSISLKIDIISLKKCDSTIYPLEVSNVALEIDEGKLIFSGTLSTAVDLGSPIKGVVEVEKKELGAWIKLPCVKKMGSCTYDDLCVHSIPANDTCPRQFVDNQVPCRCPIPKGTYTVRPTIMSLSNHQLTSIYTGTYWAKVFLLHADENLSCYEVYFNIMDKGGIYDERTKYSYEGKTDNYIEPNIELLR